MAKGNHIRLAIEKARQVAEQLENDCPASEANTRREDTANELIHALRDAASIAERQLGGTR